MSLSIEAGDEAEDVEPTACTPAAGWEKGQVENQVGVMRERFFTPRLRFASYDELNAWLLDRCMEHASAHRHPELRDRTNADVFEDEKPALMRMPTTPFVVESPADIAV